MTNHGDDCYFFYYSTCSKGDSCPFRHCEAAMGSETVCTLWEENRCFRKTCMFRHMEIKKNRSQIPCYWENQLPGCQKPHCAFHHEKPRMIDGMFIPPNKGQIPKREDEEEPASMADPSSPTPAPIGNPANPQVRGVIKAETLENVPSPTHPPVVINPADDEDEDEDDQYSEEGEENSSRMVSPRKLLSSGRNDNSLNFGVRTLEEIRLRKALKANLKKAALPGPESQGSSETPPSGPRSNGTSLEKENIRSLIRPSQFGAKEDTSLLNEESVKRRIAERLGKRKAILPAEEHFIVKKDVFVASEPPLKRTLAERLGRKVDFPEDDEDAAPRKAVKPVRDRLGLPAEPAAPGHEREVQTSGEIRIKTLEEIRQEKMAKAQGLEKPPKAQGGQEKTPKAQGQEKAEKTQGQKKAEKTQGQKKADKTHGRQPGAAVTKAPSPVNRAARPKAGIHVKTFSEVLHARKRQQQQQDEEATQRKDTGEEPGKTEAAPPPPREEEEEEEVSAKKKARAEPSQVRVKTLEEIRREKAARAQAREQEVKTEEPAAPPSAPLPKRRILRINKTAAAGADSGGNANTPEAATEKPAGPVAAENGAAADGRQDSPVRAVKVKTFQEIMLEKRLRKQQDEAAAAASGSSGSQEDSPPPSAPKKAEPLPSSPTPTQPEPTPARQRVTFRPKESAPAAPAPVAVPKATPSLSSGRAQAGSPSASPRGANSSPARQKTPPPAPATLQREEEAAQPGPAQEKEEPQTERTQSPAPKMSPVRKADTKVRPKLNVKPSMVKAASQVKLGQKRKAPQSHRSAVAAVKPLNSAPTAVEEQPPPQPCNHDDAKVPETAAPPASTEAKAQVTPLGPGLSPPAATAPLETEPRGSADAELSPAPTPPVLTPAEEPPASPQSPPAAKTPVQVRARRLSAVSARPTSATAAVIALDDLDELMNEFADDPLDGELELDPAKDEDDLLLELSEMIDG